VPAPHCFQRAGVGGGWMGGGWWVDGRVVVGVVGGWAGGGWVSGRVGRGGGCFGLSLLLRPELSSSHRFSKTTPAPFAVGSRSMGPSLRLAIVNSCALPLVLGVGVDSQSPEHGGPMEFKPTASPAHLSSLPSSPGWDAAAAAERRDAQDEFHVPQRSPGKGVG
jgi:hypothetical protein